jgi:predicted small integral membrane protein
MAIRYLKIILVCVVALQGLLFALQNIVNLDAAFQAVAYTVGRAEHTVYPESIGPTVTSPWLVWTFLSLILAGEFSVAGVAGTGAWKLWSARRSDADTFNSAKGTAILGCGLAMLVWFGGFGVIAGGMFNMWQTTAGGLSLEGAFQYAGAGALVALFVNMTDN